MTRRELSDEDVVAGMIATAAEVARRAPVPGGRAGGWLNARNGTARPQEQPPDDAHADGVLVRHDAWQRVLAQLDRLGDVARELADARERAARAETEARFLRERATHAETECRRLQERLDKLRAQTGATLQGRDDLPLPGTHRSRVETAEEPAAAEALRSWFRRRPAVRLDENEAS